WPFLKCHLTPSGGAVADKFRSSPLLLAASGTSEGEHHRARRCPSRRHIMPDRVRRNWHGLSAVALAMNGTVQFAFGAAKMSAGARVVALLTCVLAGGALAQTSTRNPGQTGSSPPSAGAGARDVQGTSPSPNPLIFTPGTTPSTGSSGGSSGQAPSSGSQSISPFSSPGSSSS